MNRIVAVILALAGLAAPASAEPRPYQPDFTFRRVGVPPAGAPRITVQIAPQPPGGPAAPAAAGAAPVPPRATAGAGQAPASALAWFWQAVPPGLDAASSGRLADAVQTLARVPDGAARVPEPSLGLLTEIAATHGGAILRSTVGTGVSPALVLAVIAVESAGRPDALSRAGAQGLMQLMPPTAARFGVADSLDPAQNIAGGVAYLDWLMGEFGRDPILVLAGYNAGEGAVRDHAGVPPYAETRDYVPRVLAAWSLARGLCRTPPELISDGCVFVTDG